MYQFIKSLDRLLPAIFFAFLLSFQSLISTGVADGITFPELIGPDGRTLTFADICNAAGENKTGQKHCASCVSNCGNVPSAFVSEDPAHYVIDYLPPQTHIANIARPEAHQALRRAPPST